MRRPLVCVSGGFDPIHIGHLRHFQEASKYGDLCVILNSDDWLKRKKGYIFMPFEERKEIILGLECVSYVTHVDDNDGTVCEALKRIKPDFYCKGGDRGKNNTPEIQVCDDFDITVVFGVGGKDKPQSSSWLVDNVREGYAI